MHEAHAKFFFIVTLPKLLNFETFRKKFYNLLFMFYRSKILNISHNNFSNTQNAEESYD